eukprot:1587038-Pyramimonas_sp.AAC.1
MDKNLDVWLLEVNESPDLRPRTPAKQRACSRMLDGMVELVLAAHAQANGDGDNDGDGDKEEEGPDIYGFRGSRQVRNDKISNMFLRNSLEDCFYLRA